jgi:hypothetical protein
MPTKPSSRSLSRATINIAYTLAYHRD